jgi:hypothetical protein
MTILETIFLLYKEKNAIRPLRGICQKDFCSLKKLRPEAGKEAFPSFFGF